MSFPLLFFFLLLSLPISPPLSTNKAESQRSGNHHHHHHATARRRRQRHWYSRAAVLAAIPMSGRTLVCGSTTTPPPGHGQWQFKQLGMEPKQSTTPLFPGAGYGNTAASPYATDLSKEDDDEKERRQQQHSFLLGAGLRLEKPAGYNHAAAAQKPLRHIFDEWPHEKSSKGSWMGLERETQLFMSITMAANDLPITTTFATTMTTAAGRTVHRGLVPRRDRRQRRRLLDIARWWWC
uniref:OSJNBa0042N22.12 protein n=1 Tax=Oryza sativa subsp. japonica TaxID=39947 RepID=Q7XPC7_ORYSJ|nr:OSJNBa0042N22.12 [Oryza sativa Japonica Group]